MMENLMAFAETLIIWGFWIAVYGIATMLVGAIILVLFKKPIVKFIKALS